MTERVFNREVLVEAFKEMGQLAFDLGKTVEISVYGGSALMLTFDWRAATRDVDAVFEADRKIVRLLVAEIAERRGWDDDWLNDGVKGFLSAGDCDPGAKGLFGTFPSEDQPGVRVMVASPAYLFAMKCRAMRVGGVDENSDVDDIRNLAAALGLASVGQALEFIARFYPNQRMEPKVQFGLEEIFDKLLPKEGRTMDDGKGCGP